MKRACLSALNVCPDVHQQSVMHLFECGVVPPSNAWPKFSHNLTAVAQSVYFGLLV